MTDDSSKGSKNTHLLDEIASGQNYITSRICYTLYIKKLIEVKLSQLCDIVLRVTKCLQSECPTKEKKKEEKKKKKKERNNESPASVRAPFARGVVHARRQGQEGGGEGREIKCPLADRSIRNATMLKLPATVAHEPAVPAATMKLCTQ